MRIKRKKEADADEMLPEYDLTGSKPNRYAPQHKAGSILITLDPDVAAVFPNSGEANKALRALAGIIQGHRPRRTSVRRSA
jgi:hypothetical protein